MSALATLEQLQGDVVAQGGRVADLDRARRDRPREFEKERAKRLAAIRGHEAGRTAASDVATGYAGDDIPTDAIVVEGGLDAPEMTDVERAAMAGLSPRVVTRPLGPGVSDVQIEWVDEDTEERFAGAQEALQAAEQRLRDFASSHFDDLQVERAPQAGAAQKALEDALAAARAAGAEYERERTWQVALLKVAGREDLIEDLPGNPAAVLADVRRVAPPLPLSLIG